MRRSGVYAALLLFGAGAAFGQTRYHYGDDLRWADPKFDDSSWPVAKDNHWPRPPFDGDGFVWARFRVPVPADYSGPLAVRLLLQFDVGGPYEVWVNGQRVSGNGSFPPHLDIRVRPVTTVFELPAGTAIQGQTAVVAWRGWFAASWRMLPRPAGFAVEIGPRILLRLEERNAIAEQRLSLSFGFVSALAYVFLGAVLIVIWRLGRGSPELLWFGIYLFLYIDGLWEFTPDLFRPALSMGWWALVDLILQWAGYSALFEFQWAVFNLKSRWVLRLLEVAGAAGFFLTYASQNASQPSAWVLFAASGWRFLFGGVELIIIAISVWQFRRSPETRGVAAALIVFSTILTLGGGGLFRAVIPTSFQLGAITIFAQDISGFLFVLAVCWLLLRRMWKTWGHARELDTEFEAARQLQQSLVPPAVDAAGFHLESAYLPARQVGGDFFWTAPAADASLLLVTGDVSGKGLKAAMTVATLAGALRNETSRQPARVLAQLNSVLVGHGGAGFTTCCAALFEPDGRVTLANAGHLPPYRNGEELHSEPGLPLGLIADAEYKESQLKVAPGDTLTFVSDGVVEARNAKGELYGFDRTRALSNQPASQSADTAQAFGQEDDITVVSITIKAAETHAA